MAMFEFVLIFLIGGVSIAATVGHDRSVVNCTCAVITIGLLHTFVSWAKSHSPRFGAIVDGSPIVIYGLHPSQAGGDSGSRPYRRP